MRAPNTLTIVRTLLASLVALILTAALTGLIYLHLFEHINPQFMTDMDDPGTTLHLRGSQFRPVVAGAGGVAGDTTIVTGLSDGRAILQADLSAPAAQYPFMKLQTTGLQPDIELELYWRTTEEPNENLGAVLHPGRDGSYYFNLGSEDKWRGTINTLALGIYGDLHGQPLELQSLSLHGFSPKLLLATLWQEWSGYRVWDMTSINRLEGIPPKGLQYLTPLLAVWSALACLVVLLLSKPLGLSRPLAIGMALIVPWLTLDGLWQRQLSKQLIETRLAYDGIPTQHRHISPRDARLYDYVTRLKQEILTTESPRIFVVHQSHGHDFDRLRVQYHLLPHNVYNFGVHPPAGSVRAGDYILLLGGIGDNQYDPDTHSLTSRQENPISVELVDTDALGNLFRVTL